MSLIRFVLSFILLFGVVQSDPSVISSIARAADRGLKKIVGKVEGVIQHDITKERCSLRTVNIDERLNSIYRISSLNS